MFGSVLNVCLPGWLFSYCCFDASEECQTHKLPHARTRTHPLSVNCDNLSWNDSSGNIDCASSGHLPFFATVKNFMYFVHITLISRKELIILCIMVRYIIELKASTQSSKFV